MAPPSMALASCDRRQNGGQRAQVREGFRLGLIVGAKLLPLEGGKRVDRLAAVDGGWVGRVGSDHEELLIPAQCIGGDQAAIGERSLPRVAKLARQLDQHVVGKPIGRLAGNDECDVRHSVENLLRLLGQCLDESAVGIDIDLEKSISLAIDPVHERFDAILVDPDVLRPEERQFERDRLGGGREREQQGDHHRRGSTPRHSGVDLISRLREPEIL